MFLQVVFDKEVSKAYSTINANIILVGCDISILYFQTPGPASYGANDPNLTSRRRPAFTMRPKVDAPGDSTRKPGPGQHSPENVSR